MRTVLWLGSLSCDISYQRIVAGSKDDSIGLTLHAQTAVKDDIFSLHRQLACRLNTDFNRIHLPRQRALLHLEPVVPRYSQVGRHLIPGLYLNHVPNNQITGLTITL